MPKSALFQPHFSPARALVLAAAAVIWISVGSGCGINGHVSSIDDSAKRMADQVELMNKQFATTNQRLELTNQQIALANQELAAYRAYLKTVAEQMQVMAQALFALQQLGDSTVNLIIQRLFTTSPTPVTPPGGLEDLFPSPSATPRPSPTPSPGAHP